MEFRPKRLSTRTNKGLLVDSWDRLPSTPQHRLRFSPNDRIALSPSSSAMARRSQFLPIRAIRTSAPSVMLQLTTPAKLYSSDFLRTSAREFLSQVPLKI